MSIDIREIELANARREIRETYGNKCFYCHKDFSNTPYEITVHHRDFLGYNRRLGRNPFDRVLAKPACLKCHFEIHFSAAMITLGLLKTISLETIQDFLTREKGISQEIVSRVTIDLLFVGVSAKRIARARKSILYRILNHACASGYFNEINQKLYTLQAHFGMKP